MPIYIRLTKPFLKKSRPLYFLPYIIIILSYTGQAQIISSSVFPDSSYLRTDFTKQNDTWNWNFRLQSVEKISDIFSWDIRESINSNLITPKGSPNRWKDEYKSHRLFYWDFSNYKTGLYTDTWILIDKQNKKENEYSTNAAGLFSIYSPASAFSIIPYLGYQKARNISKSDWGWDTGIEGTISNYNFGEYKSTLAASTDLDVFENRQNYINKFNASIATDFTTFTRDSLKFDYEESSKEFYDPSDSTGTALIKVDYFSRLLKNILFYDLSYNKFLKFQTNIESKEISYLTTRKIFLIGSELSYQHFGDGFNYNIGFKTSDETNDNEKIRTDSRNRNSSLSLKTFYQINHANDIKFDVAYAKLQYDTPDDSVNHDDRDEQRIVIDIKYWHQFSPALTLDVNAYGFLFHQIYLNEEQSHNNNWNRIIQLTPEVSYKSQNLSNRLTTSVSANYTEYDFDHLFEEKRSFLSRKYSITDSLLTPLFYRFKIGFLGKIEKEEKGSFFSENFSQNIIQSFSSTRINTFVTKTLLQRFNFKLGYSYFERKEWRHIPKKEKVRTIINKGPFLNFAYSVAQRINLTGFVSHNKYKDSGLSSSSFINSYLKLIYYL